MKDLFYTCIILSCFCVSNVYADTVQDIGDGDIVHIKDFTDSTTYRDLERMINPWSAENTYRHGEDLYRNWNSEESIVLLKQAANENHFLAKVRLVLLNFIKTKRNTDIECECFSKLSSMAENNIDAAILLSSYYKQGCGTNKDIKKMIDIRLKFV